jgi:hypothetical protein
MNAETWKRPLPRAVGYLLFAYLLLPAAYLTFWFVDLWAKDYDSPPTQVAAKALLALAAVLLLTAAAVVVTAASRAVRESAARWGVYVLTWPVLAAVAWLIYDLDWRAVYVAGVIAPVMVCALWHPARARGPLAAAIVVAVVVRVIGAYGEVPSVRLERYARQLRWGCWCCGYRERAIHELAGLGAAGRAVLQQYMSEDPEHEQEVTQELGGRRTSG